MAELFSDDWMAAYLKAWNGDPELAGELGKIGFSSTIGYGFKGDSAPLGVLTVENGAAVCAGTFDGQQLNWDLRADPATWAEWLKEPPGMMGLGMAYTASELQFVVGDYAAMIKDPRMAGPFVKSFAAMAKVA